MMGTDTDTGIDFIPFSGKETAGDICNRAGNIMLSGFDSAVPVTITDINGMNVLRAQTNADGCLVIGTSQYPSGIYIVKVQNKTFKFIKR